MAQLIGKMVTYPTGHGYYMIYKDNKSTFDLGSNKGKKEPVSDFDEVEEYRDYDNRQRSVRRAKSMVRDYIACNSFSHFVTLTFSGEQSKDDDVRLKILSNWLTYMKRKHGKFNYVVVPERHKDGSLHFHGVFDLKNFELKKGINPKNGKHVIRRGQQVYNITSWELNNGWGHAEIIRDQMKVASYMTKYVVKDFETTVSKNKKKYWCSKGLELPVQSLLTRIPKLVGGPAYENDYIQIYHF